MKAIKLKNKKTVYVHYGWAATRDFAKTTGRTLKQLETIGEDMTVDDMLCLLWAGLKHGARKKGKDFFLTVDDASDLLDENKEMLEIAMSEYAASQAVPEESPNPQAGAPRK